MGNDLDEYQIFTEDTDKYIKGTYKSIAKQSYDHFLPKQLSSPKKYNLSGRTVNNNGSTFDSYNMTRHQYGEIGNTIEKRDSVISIDPQMLDMERERERERRDIQTSRLKIRNKDNQIVHLV